MRHLRHRWGFWRLSKERRQRELVGQDLTNYFPPPLTLACPGLVTQTSVELVYKSGASESAQGTVLDNAGWYTATFQPKIKNFHKGPLVWTTKEVAAQVADQTIQRIWAIWESSVYDLTDYINTVTINQGHNESLPIPEHGRVRSNINCLKNMFYLGETDFRDTPRCLVQNYLLLVFTSILCASIVLKFLSALQLSPKRSPEMQDKFILCQIPCYTEGEDSLRRTLDSLASLNYDDKRKLLAIICD
ncbi:chitin synthase-domain-containing protein, partial [Suillus occidentalis]